MITYPTNKLQKVLLSGGTEQRNVPIGFTQVESLANTSGAYIATSISLDDNDEIEFWWNAETSGSIFAFSQGASANNEAFQLANTDATGIVFDIQNYNPYRINTNVQAYNNGVKHIVIKNREIFIDGVSYGTSQGSVTNPTDVLRLFISSAGTTSLSKFTNRFTVKNKINLIFCRRNSDSELGMYDTVSQTFLTNAGTGSFTAGADVTVPSPDTPMDIVCNNGVVKVSRNLFDNATRVNEYFISETGVIMASQAGTYSALIPVKPNTTYVFSGINGAATTANKRLHAYDSNGAWLEQLNFATNIQNNNPFIVTGTTTAQTAYVRISLATSDTKVQLELGSTATPYMPYGQIYVDGTQEVVTDNLGNTANAEMLLDVGDYKDTQEVISGAVTRRCGVLVLNGTEDWNNTVMVNTWTISADAQSSIPYCPPTSEDPDRTILCTHLNNTDTLPQAANRQGYIIKGVNGFISLGTITAYPTVEDWNAFLAEQYANGTPVIIVYPLAEPTTEQVTPQPLAGNTATVTAGSIDNLPIESSTIAELKKRYIGDNEVKRVYIGDNLVWENN